MKSHLTTNLRDTGERMIPTAEGELSFVFERHKIAYTYASNFVQDRIVLDVGCGTGYGCKMLSQWAKMVCGIDHSEEAVLYSQKFYSGENIFYGQMNAAALGFNKQIFDVVVSFQVIEHLPDPDMFLSELKRVIKTGGLIIISTPNVRKQKFDNPFHLNEMDLNRFVSLLQMHFTKFKILGTQYAKKNRLRKFAQSLPFYRLGVVFKRRSFVKKFADRALDLTGFTIAEENCRDALDLIAFCYDS
jgi:2-polyprenyl-3-methyl-5-hydroxy-6-metoxy-1,4-benzoquinol methylase